MKNMAIIDSPNPLRHAKSRLFFCVKMEYRILKNMQNKHKNLCVIIFHAFNYSLYEM